MALNPRFAGQKLVPSGSGKTLQTLHTLEFFLDYVCPFSAKQFKTLYEIIPLVKQKYPDKVQFIFRQQIQPWHPSSTLVHEAGAAVLRTNPDKFWDFSERLFEKQTDFFDVNVVNEARNKTYERLAKIAGDVGVDSKKIYHLLEVSDKPDKDGNTNIGNGVTDDIKIMTKVRGMTMKHGPGILANERQTNRLVGVHVTPTVVFNGVVEGGISSSFTKEDWDKWLAKNIT